MGKRTTETKRQAATAPPVPARSGATTTATTSTNRRPPQRRGSVTNPVKRQPPWTLIVSALLGLVAVVALVLLVVNQGGNSSAAPQPTQAAAPVAGAAAPDFSVTGTDGATLTKASVAGKPTLLVFFASWCAHCQAEAPRLKALAEANPDLQIVMVGADYREAKEAVYGFRQKFALPFPTYFDAGKAAAAFGVQSYPTLIAVDKSGTVRGLKTGEVSPAELAAFVGSAMQ